MRRLHLWDLRALMVNGRVWVSVRVSARGRVRWRVRVSVRGYGEGEDTDEGARESGVRVSAKMRA